MIVKAVMLLLLIIAGLSLTIQGMVYLLTEFVWTSILEIASIFILMVLFPSLYLASHTINYRLWKYASLDKVIHTLDKKTKSLIKDPSQGLKVIKKKNDFFLAEVKGLHTKFFFVLYRIEKLEISHIELLINEISSKSENILIFCTGVVGKEVKNHIKNLKYNIIIEDYKNVGDFNLKKYFVAPSK